MAAATAVSRRRGAAQRSCALRQADERLALLREQARALRAAYLAEALLREHYAAHGCGAAPCAEAGRLARQTESAAQRVDACGALGLEESE